MSRDGLSAVGKVQNPQVLDFLRRVFVAAREGKGRVNTAAQRAGRVSAHPSKEILSQRIGFPERVCQVGAAVGGCAGGPGRACGILAGNRLPTRFRERRSSCAAPGHERNVRDSVCENPQTSWSRTIISSLASENIQNRTLKSGFRAHADGGGRCMFNVYWKCQSSGRVTTYDN